jgi:hypothetical protein
MATHLSNSHDRFTVSIAHASLAQPAVSERSRPTPKAA